MIHALRIVDDRGIEARHQQRFGGFNDFPPNWREITEKEFAQSAFFVESIQCQEYRQMGEMRPGGKPLLGATLYFLHDGTGYAIAADYWGGRIRYYAFAACVHEYRAPTEAEHRAGVPRPAHCFHVAICGKCSHVRAVDSSD